MYMKKTLSLLLVFALCLALCACGGNDTPATTEATEPPVEETVYKLGETIETDLFKITPVFTGYSYALSNIGDETYLTRITKRESSNPYATDEGKTQIYGEIQVEYIGSEKTDVSLSIAISANYDDGYVFEGDDVAAGHCVTPGNSWNSYGPMVFEPLSDSNTRIMRFCIEVPEQVETNTDKSLLVTFFVNGEPFVYDFRSADVLGSDYDPRAEFYQPIDDETKAHIVSWLKTNGLAEMGWYDRTVGVFTFTFGDTAVNAVLPINSSYQYEFKGTYEVYSGTILITWDYGQQMHLDYTFDGTTLDIIDFQHDR